MISRRRFGRALGKRTKKALWNRWRVARVEFSYEYARGVSSCGLRATSGSPHVCPSGSFQVMRRRGEAWRFARRAVLYRPCAYRRISGLGAVHTRFSIFAGTFIISATRDYLLRCRTSAAWYPSAVMQKTLLP